MKTVCLRAVVAGVAVTALVIWGCPEALQHLTASRGGSVVGGQGTVRAVFINNTPHTAVFTVGTYDSTDQFSRPDFVDFGLNGSDRVLDGNATSEIIDLACARVFSIGGPDLLALIDANLADPDVNSESFIEGIAFFRESDEDGGDSAGDPVQLGTAPPFEAFLGIDFPCSSLLIVRFEFDDPAADQFRIDFELIPSTSDR